MFERHKNNFLQEKYEDDLRNAGFRQSTPNPDFLTLKNSQGKDEIYRFKRIDPNTHKRIYIRLQ